MQMDARNNKCFSVVFLNPDVGKEPQSYFSFLYLSYLSQNERSMR